MTAVSVESVLEQLSACSPVMRVELKKLADEWEPEVAPATVTFGALGTSLSAEILRVDTCALECICHVIEQALSEGSESAKNAVATGLLEAVLSAADSNPETARFLKMLGPLSRKYCQDWDGFCGCHTPGVWLGE